MPFGNHALDEIGVRGRGVDFTFSVVVSSDEECSMEAITFKNIQELGSVLVWTVIV